MDFNLNYWTKTIFGTSNIIDENIKNINKENRAIESSNILSHLRDLLQAVTSFIYLKDSPTEPCSERHSVIQKSLLYVKTKTKYYFLFKINKLYQMSVSHYTIGTEYSETLMIKYYEHLVVIKDFLNQFNISILPNLTRFPLDLDDSIENYYRLIIPKLNIEYEKGEKSGSDSYYIQKKKAVFIDNVLFYEYTLSNAMDNVSKFERFVCYSKLNILENYSIRALFKTEKIIVFGKTIDVLILSNYWIAIRPCEIEHYAEIFNIRFNMTRTNQYENAMKFIKSTSLSLANIIEDKWIYEHFINYVEGKGGRTSFIDLIKKSRDLIIHDSVGSNVLRYLLATMRNTVIKSQTQQFKNPLIANLCLQNGTLTFDSTPLSTSLIDHNPDFGILLDTFDADSHKDEFLKRRVDDNSNNNNMLYLQIEKNEDIKSIQKMVDSYNNRFDSKYFYRRLSLFGNNLFIEGSEQNTANVIRKLTSVSSKRAIPNYSSFILNSINNTQTILTDSDQKDVIENMFTNSSLFCIYGAAGTGKSTIIGKEFYLLGNIKKLCLANTHPALNNLKNKVNASNVTFSTVRSFLSKKQQVIEYDIVAIDECSTISTRDMVRILEKLNTKLLILAGDIYQIESIEFGNWFSLLRCFIDKRCMKELTNQHRTTDKHLPILWERVRNLDDNIQETLNTIEVSHKLDESIFKKIDDDEIILCLGYDGLFGINNINRILQAANENPPISWKHNIYKVDDPIVFIDSNLYGGYLHNNLKGKIVKIDKAKDGSKISFVIDVETILQSLIDYRVFGFELISTENNKSRVKIDIFSGGSKDYDRDTPSNRKVSFQIAYAISIHKAQGLEYNSVKVIVTKDVGELVTHNVFYTAITRAKKVLNIYWFPETENEVIKNFKKKNIKRDANILSSRFGLQIINKID